MERFMAIVPVLSADLKPVPSCLLYNLLDHLIYRNDTTQLQSTVISANKQQNKYFNADNSVLPLTCWPGKGKPDSWQGWSSSPPSAVLQGPDRYIFRTKFNYRLLLVSQKICTNNFAKYIVESWADNFAQKCNILLTNLKKCI